MDFKKVGFWGSIVANAALMAGAGGLVTLVFSQQSKIADLESSDEAQWGTLADVELQSFQNSVESGVKEEMLEIIKALLTPENAQAVHEARLSLQEEIVYLQNEPEVLTAPEPEMFYPEEETAVAKEEVVEEEVVEEEEEMAQQEEEFEDMVQQQQRPTVTGEELDRYIENRKNRSKK